MLDLRFLVNVGIPCMEAMCQDITDTDARGFNDLEERFDPTDVDIVGVKYQLYWRIGLTLSTYYGAALQRNYSREWPHGRPEDEALRILREMQDKAWK